MNYERKVVDTTKKPYNKEELKEMCNLHGIETEKIVADVIPGWCNQPKGMLQVLFERGYIDPSLVKHPKSMRYAKKGKEVDIGEDGELTEDGRKFSLEYLLNQCEDFINEKNDLEHLASELTIGRATNQISILFTPKFHCELAGEGVEYSWGASKRIYRKIPLSKKRSYFKFERQVKKSLAQININMCRKFSGKARGYMLGYFHQKVMIDEASDQEKEEVVSAMSSFGFNENIQKIYRSHRDAGTFDAGFIDRIIRECMQIDE